ncbi:MAG: hypothetical protein WA962_00210 [Ornithinimicrobium sp.]
MSPEGPEDSPAVNEPTTTSAVEPLPPGSHAEEVVDAIDERIKKSWSQMEADDDTATRRSNGPDEPADAEDDDGESPSEPTD